jgi:uncharacterized protein (DUF1697 family)
MPALRELLTEAGFDDVRTYVQSGNVILDSELDADALAAQAHDLISERFGFAVDVVVRSRGELAAVVERDPLGHVATEPKLYQVSFLTDEPDPQLVRRLSEVAVEGEQVVAIGRELYAWLPRGAARSKLWSSLARPGSGLLGTARNWRTVTALLDLADA